MIAADAFDRITVEHRETGAQLGTGFAGSPGLRIGGKIFAMLRGDAMVVKLPAERCRQLVDEGAAEPFHSGRGAPMREWVSCAEQGRWPDLAREARTFVAGSTG